MAVAYQESISNTSGSATSLTASGFVGLTVGDLMVAQFSVGNSSITVTPPASWTLIVQTANPVDVMTSYLAYKIATAGDVSGNSFQFSHNVAATVCKLYILRINGHRIVSTIPTSSGQANDTTATITAPTVTPTMANSMLLFFTFADSSSNSVSSYAIATSNPTWTEIYDNNANNYVASCAWSVRPEVTATGSGTATAAVSSNNVGQLVVVSAPQIISQTDTVTSTDSFLGDLTLNSTDTVTSTEAMTIPKSRSWTANPKSSTTWTAETK